MGLNVKCPKCGSTKVQCSNERSKHGCLWFIIFGIFYVIFVFLKWMIGIMCLILWDWWMAIVKSCMGKGHIWQSRKWILGTKKIYYCHDCGHNFRY